MEHLMKLLATGTCFDAQFPRQHCCLGNGRGNPDCFAEGGFETVTERACCRGDYSGLRVPRLDALVALGAVESSPELEAMAAGAAAGWVTQPDEGSLLISVPMGKVVNDICRSALRIYRLAAQIANDDGDARADFAVKSWRKAVMGRFPVFGLLLRGRRQDWDVVQTSEKVLNQFRPELFADGSTWKFLPYLQTAYLLFDGSAHDEYGRPFKKSAKWEALVDLAQLEFQRGHNFEDEEATRAAYALLDGLWTLANPPLRWRGLDLNRVDPWWRLLQGGEAVQRLVPSYQDDWSKNPDVGRLDASQLPEYARPWLYFLSDANLYAGTDRCAALAKGVMAELRERSDRNWTVLDVGAGTAPCGPAWRALGGHVTYMTQDFGGYETGESHAERVAKVREESQRLGISHWAYESSIHNNNGYAELDMRSDITNIPLASGTVDVIVCDQVIEHVPDPVHAMREAYRLLAPGGRLFLSHPYGSYLHNLPYHFNGGFTHAWFEHHLPRIGFTKVMWNYRFERMGTALHKVLLSIDCISAALQDVILGRMVTEVVMRIIRPYVDAMPALCPGLERKPQGVNVVAVK